MQRFKKNIAVMLVFCMSVMLFSACPTTTAQTTDLQIDQTEQIEPMTPEQALLMSSSYPQTTSELEPVEAKTNVANVAVQWAPVWTSPTFEVLPSGKDIGIIHREYDYYYIQYESGGVTKRGYVSRSCTSTVVSTWCDHSIFTPGQNLSVNTQKVYYRPTANSAEIETLDSEAGIDANKPLIVLSRYGNFFHVQYVGNPDGGGAHMQWKRGWVYAGAISVNTFASFSQISGKTTFYIQNVGTGRYLTLEDPNAANKSNLIIQDFEGTARQKWTLEVGAANTLSSQYVTIKSEATSSNSTDKIISIKDALSVINTRMEIRNKGNPPSKDQEFYIKTSGYTSADGSTEYNICSRLTGNYMQLGVYADQQGNGGPVLNKYPYTTWYNRWRLIPADTKFVKIIYDDPCTKTEAQIETAFLNAVAGFKTQFDIDFKIFSISQQDFSNGEDCPNGNMIICGGEACGTSSICNTTHHKSSIKNMAKIEGFTDYYTFKIVSHALCRYKDSSHNNVAGTGSVGGYFAIATTDSIAVVNYDVTKTIRHELSHNLGASHEKCDFYTNTMCILKDNSNTWCATCAQEISKNN